jgi:hypothetical protein
MKKNVIKTIKKSLLLILLLGFQQAVFAQLNTKTKSELEALKVKAIKNEDYASAAKYKRAIDIKSEIQKALNQEDYSNAASLKKELLALDSSNGSTVEVNTNQNSPTEFNSNGIEFYNTVYLVNKISNETSKLEKQTAIIETSSYNALYVAGSTSYWTVKGYSSPTQITKNDQVKFITKIEKGVDPSSIFKLYHLGFGGKKEFKRQYLSFKTTAAAYTGASTSQNADNDIAIEFKKIKDEIYEVVINQELIPGEYAFVLGSTWHLFGVKNKISTNSQISVSELKNYTTSDVYQLDPSLPKIAYLGVDFSLLRIKADKFIGQDVFGKNQLIDGLDIFNNKQVKHGKIDSWIDKKGQTFYYPSFGRTYGKNNLPSRWILSSADPYELNEQLIRDHIKNYDINSAGLGFVFIPGVIDSEKKNIYGYFVWFDFESKKIINMTKIEGPSNIVKKIKSPDFIVDFLYQYKRYTDRYYRQNKL